MLKAIKEFFFGTPKVTPAPQAPYKVETVETPANPVVATPAVTEGATKGGNGSVKKPTTAKKPAAPKSSNKGGTVAKVNQPKPQAAKKPAAKTATKAKKTSK